MESLGLASIPRSNEVDVLCLNRTLETFALSAELLWKHLLNKLGFIEPGVDQRTLTNEDCLRHHTVVRTIANDNRVEAIIFRDQSHLNPDSSR